MRSEFTSLFHAMTKRAVPSSPIADPKTPSTGDDVYKEFTRWKSARPPTWHPVKKMRYVFWRMMRGRTVMDAINEIHWEPRFFWHQVDENFAGEYKSAKVLQSRAFADSLVAIAEGRDLVSRRMRRSLEKKIRLAVRRAKSNKGLTSMIVKSVTESISENQRDLIARNKLQIDTMKWMASKANPIEFGEKSSVSLGGFDPTGEGRSTSAIAIAFVAPDGKDVPFNVVVKGADE